MQDTWDGIVFYVIGLFWFVRFLHRLLKWVFVYIGPSSISRYLHKEGGKPAWALVTGASDGIGRALARESARRGFNVLLHGRNLAKLEAVIADVRGEFPERNFRVLIADAFAGGPEMKRNIETIVEEVKDLNLKVLVNNAGGTPSSIESRFESFDLASFEDTADTMNLNGSFPIQLTGALLPQLIAHQPSLVITLGSFADYGQPYLAVYGGCKAMLLSWTLGLSRELAEEKRGVEVLGVPVAEVAEVSHNYRTPNLIMPSASTFAKSVFNRVGRGETIVNAYWVHGLLRAVMDRLPRFVVGSLLMDGMKVQMEEYAKHR